MPLSAHSVLSEWAYNLGISICNTCGFCSCVPHIKEHNWCQLPVKEWKSHGCERYSIEDIINGTVIALDDDQYILYIYHICIYSIYKIYMYNK